MTEAGAAERDAVNLATLTLDRELRQWLRRLAAVVLAAVVSLLVFVRGIDTYDDGISIEATAGFLLLLASVGILGGPIVQAVRVRKVRRIVAAARFSRAALTTARVGFGPLAWTAVAVDDGEQTRVVVLVPGRRIRSAVAADGTGWIADRASYLAVRDWGFPVLLSSGPVFHVPVSQSSGAGLRAGRRTRAALLAAGADLRAPRER